MNYKIKLLIILVLIGSIFIVNKMSWQGGDFSILSIDQNNVSLINISSDRGMVNSYKISNMDLWIPNGMGWYPAERLGMIIKNDVNLAKKVTFYNFGFWPKEVSLSGKWNSEKSLWSMLGPFGYIRFKILSEDWLWKNDNLKDENYDEIIPRDLSDNKIIANDIKINIVNASGKNGFGNMIADRLEWYGLMVLSVQTADVEKGCRLVFDFNSKANKTLIALAEIINCEKINQAGVVELVLGEDLSEMLKYSQTYVRSF